MNININIVYNSMVKIMKLKQYNSNNMVKIVKLKQYNSPITKHYDVCIL